MGYTFAAALVKKTGTAPATRKAIREGFEALGYCKAKEEEASLVVPLHHDKKSAWMTLTLDMPEDLHAQTEQLKQLSAAMHTPILYFMNFDSDFLYVAATDGKQVQHVHVGFIDEDDDDPENAGAMTDSEDLSVFDALLPDDAARAEFRRILAVDVMERVFSESAAQEMAALFGYTPEALFVDEDAEPFAQLAFAKAEGALVPLYMPEDAPPAFTTARSVRGTGNPIAMELHSCGGKGRGVRVALMAEGYDAADWELLPLHLTNQMPFGGAPVEEPYTATAQPKRITFSDGSAGWVAEFPDAPIPCGVNPDVPNPYAKHVIQAYARTGYLLRLAFEGGNPPEGMPPVMNPSMELMQDKNALREWLLEQFKPVLENPEKTHIWVYPVDNRDGAVHHEVPRAKLARPPFWLEKPE